MANGTVKVNVAVATRPTLAEGEMYAGILLGMNGEPDHHIILLPGDNDDADWNTQMEWARSIGGELPTRREQHLLIANLKHEFKADWYWSGELHASDPVWAWFQFFSNGGQHDDDKSGKLRARAVRRLVIE